jgi:hypothetical protein
VLRAGAKWKALYVTGICSGSSAHRQFQEWSRTGVFKRLGGKSLKKYDDLKGLDWSHLSMDGAFNEKTILWRDQLGGV